MRNVSLSSLSAFELKSHAVFPTIMLDTIRSGLDAPLQRPKRCLCSDVRQCRRSRKFVCSGPVSLNRCLRFSHIIYINVFTEISTARTPVRSSASKFPSISLQLESSVPLRILTSATIVPSSQRSLRTDRPPFRYVARASAGYLPCP